MNPDPNRPNSRLRPVEGGPIGGEKGPSSASDSASGWTDAELSEQAADQGAEQAAARAWRKAPSPSSTLIGSSSAPIDSPQDHRAASNADGSISRPSLSQDSLSQDSLSQDSLSQDSLSQDSQSQDSLSQERMPVEPESHDADALESEPVVEESGDAVVGRSRLDRKSAQRAQKSRRRWRIALVVSGSIFGVVILVAAAGFGYLWYENHRIHRVHIKHLSAVESAGQQKDVENILLIGSTTRCGLAQQNKAFGLCDQGVTGVNSDVVMILHLDPDHHRASILSIPRDTLVPNARHDGLNKIDAALGDPDGPGQLIAAITDDFGIPIQHYVELNFDSFQGVVEALGGVKMYFPMPVYDLESSLYQPNAGCQALNGFQALAVVRARHLQYQPARDAGLPRYDWPYDPQSDLSRIRRDHEFLRVLASAVAHRGLGNFITDLSLINSIAGNLEVDQGFSATEMASLVLQFHGVDPNSVPQYTLPVVVDGQGYYYRGGGYGDVVFPIEPEDSQTVRQFLGTGSGTDASGGALPSPGSFTVAVENASGIYDNGSKTAAALEALGYDVTSVTNSYSGASTSETTVLYSDPSKLSDASQVLSSISGLAVLGYDPGIVLGATTTATSSSPNAIDVGTPLPASEAADVVVVVGSNFEVAVPASSTTTTVPGSSTTSTSLAPANGSGSRESSTTTTVPSSIADNPNLVAPSSSTQSLEPWDPRSCTPSGGPGP
jgi:LCP family protein required for cell wall assembly